MSLFKELLNRANEQPDAQQILFLFAATEVTRKSRKRDTRRGTVTPVMMVDKSPAQLSDFSELVKEADAINTDWDMIFIACLSGQHLTQPDEDDIGHYLKQMASDVESGTNINRYVVFDRKENPIEISAS